MSIVMAYENIVESFKDNHNRLTYFKNENKAYYELIDKAILVVCKMAEWYKENEQRGKEQIKISGGGGGGDTYTVFCGHNQGFFYKSIGNVEIDFKNRTLAVQLDKWRNDKEKGSYYKKPYDKHIDLKELEAYKEKFKEVKEEKEESEAEKALKEIEKYSLELGDMTNDYWFSHYYENLDNFYQVKFYDRRFTYSGATSLVACTKEQKEKIVNGIKLYNKKMKQLIEKYGKETFTFNKVGDDIGYCHVDVFERSKKKEKKKRSRMENYSVKFDEVNCSSCGDGGCVHCNPSDYVNFPIKYS